MAGLLLALIGGCRAEAGSICTGDDPASLTLAMLLPSIIAAELNEQTTAAGLALLETLIRRVHQVTGMWLDMIAADKASRPSPTRQSNQEEIVIEVVVCAVRVASPSRVQTDRQEAHWLDNTSVSLEREHA